jgi:hypothetical protein
MDYSGSEKWWPFWALRVGGVKKTAERRRGGAGKGEIPEISAR